MTRPHKLSCLGKTHSSVVFGSVALIAKTSGYLSAAQLEAARRVISPHFKTQGQFWIRVFPHFPETQKPKEVRMGKGKGTIAYWYCPIKRNQVLFEFTSIYPSLLQTLLRVVGSKLSFRITSLKR